MGRFIIWTKSAFDQLDSVFGTVETESKEKRGYRLPQAPMTNSDLTRLINSDEIQSVVRPKKTVSSQHSRTLLCCKADESSCCPVWGCCCWIRSTE